MSNRYDRPRHSGGPRGPRDGGSQGPRGSAGSPGPATRPAAYRDGSQLRAALFDAEAQDEARRWAAIKSSQLRRFYAAVMGFVRRLDLDRAISDTDAQVSMALQKASATYAAARTSDHAPIRDYFAHHATLVKTREDYRDFARHFEAVIAYHRAFSTERAGGETER